MTLQREVSRVVRNDNCTGCGACAWMFPNVSMQLTTDGYMRPIVQTRGSRADAKRFKAVCPGVAVSQVPATTHHHEVFGPYVSAWQGWARDNDLRHAGSSGGVLSALSAWMLEENSNRTIVASASSDDKPSRTVPVRLSTRAEVEAAASSRYAPVANLPLLGEPTGEDAMVGKPCEVAAARQRFELDGTEANDRPLLLSFFCAGTPSQWATDQLSAKLGVTVGSEKALRYRGNGWPGSFTVEGSDGVIGTMSYHDSWGGHLGRQLQWRCKICPHGTGDHADIAVGDFWESDDSGYPSFVEGDGNSVIIARTAKGHSALLAAVGAGAVVLKQVDLTMVTRVQPLQVKRIQTLFGRLGGRVLAGKRIPRYKGFGLAARARRHPVTTAKTVASTWLRSMRHRPTTAPIRDLNDEGRNPGDA